MIRAMANGIATPLAACAGGDQRMADEAGTNISRADMGHVVTGWRDRPDRIGRFWTARTRAEMAAQNAGFLASRPDGPVSLEQREGGLAQAARHIQFMQEGEGMA